MWSLYINNPSELELKEFQSEQSVKDNEVRIKPIYGGICGSDISVFKGRLPHATYPIRPGHELVGTIIDAGEKVEYEIGTRVVVGPNTFCGTCEYCSKGQTNICLNKESLGVNRDGGFSEEFVIPSRFVLPVPDHLLDELAVLIEPFSVVVHALDKVNIAEGTRIAIIGCGTEGMLAVALAHYLGATITAVDVNTEKLKKVEESFLGVVSSLPSEMKDDYFDVVIEAAGVESAVIQAVDVVKPGGDVVLVGMATEATLPIVRIVRKEVTIHGSIIYNFPDDFQKSINFLSEECFNAKPVISKVFPFREYVKAYNEAVSGRHGKIILDFREECSE
ncbi:zinc-dependent alcohol dehydrogenase [Halalkalibacterium halodurans]|uniref:Sorbitol dehydrogenase n=1 Tax=Halalkalibacterium halodurans TaxID=86665 RepID=A0A0M0KDL1_ALKHA|nr:alcohol dehydrogenase catalytic domain-containing protein [Halalkalibacterium halodurans]MDY7220920.1 alcohol dehydrogenase catalytic domain-containing protein [Halalkalibacterium halodurans]MDY7240159.1 alcohol dehydrogenase catalytic domain-containing protein [Halalkalibacterium halodurans]TPE69738.1 zinc-binding dehydrogenase [Halalkalibacterium halodurans]